MILPEQIADARQENISARQASDPLATPAAQHIIRPAISALADQYVGMNKTEKRRALELDAMKARGEICEWWYEAVTFKLAHDTRYTPDFLVQEMDGSLRLEEVKGGFFRDDAKVKAKVCASLFPFPLVVLQQKSKRSGWTTILVKP